MSAGTTRTLTPTAGRRLALRQALAISVGRAAGALSRTTGRGGGTALPGTVALRLDRGLLARLAGDLSAGAVIVSGTNGKTTTCRMLAAAFSLNGQHTVANREGANLLSGVLAALMSATGPGGRLQSPGSTLGLFELDEAALPAAAAALSPRLVVLTNLMRDQLDRYFELDFLRLLWRRGLHGGIRPPALVVNADDAQLVALAEDLGLRTVTFGLEDLRHDRGTLDDAADARRCPRCQELLTYSAVFYAHLGHFRCTGCGWARPLPDVAASEVRLGRDHSTVHVVCPGADPFVLHVPLGGLHNVENALAAVAAARALGLAEETIGHAVAAVRGAFGRAESTSIDGHDVLLVLVKNPAGFNVVTRWLAASRRAEHLLLGLNDGEPDGRDVSWIWDADVEGLAPSARWVACTGRRAADLALRVEYAGLAVALVDPDPLTALRSVLGRLPARAPLSIVVTYTVMWQLRHALVRAGRLAPFWADKPEPVRAPNAPSATEHTAGA